MADVAAAAGVSQQTVSRVVNGSVNVSDNTREKVNRAMERLGFRPNFAGRSLRSGSYKAIGLCLFDLSQAGNLQTLSGISAAARESGYAVTLSTLEEGSALSLCDVASQMGELPIDGLIIRVPVEAEDFYDFSPSAGLPTVMLSMYSHPRCTTVENDQYGCGRMAVEHLMGLGHEVIRFVAGPSSSVDSRYREAAWRETLESAGLCVTEPLVGDWSADSGYEAGAQLAKDELMTAVFAENDTMALGVVEALRDAGVRVPEDVSVIGVDDSLQGMVPRNELTTIRLDRTAMGRAAFESLIGGLEGSTRAEALRLECELVVRGTTGPRR
jgi:DNA-binding LacI/PurR family transcriptional regulator